MTFQELGKILQEERLRRGLSVHDIMEITKISRVNIEALETGDPNGLPHAVYTKGFIRSYARVLKLDTDELLLSLDSEMRDFSDDGPSLTPGDLLSSTQTIQDMSQTREKGRGKGALWLVLVLLLGLGVVGAIMFMNKGTGMPDVPPGVEQAQPKAESDAPAVSEPSVTAPGDETLPAESKPTSESESNDDQSSGQAEAMADVPVQVTAVDVPAQAPAVDTPSTAESQEPALLIGQTDEEGVNGKYEHNLVIRATANIGCWIGVWRGDEEKMYRNYVLAKGEPLNLMFNTPRRIRIGNVAGVEVTYNGKPYSLDGSKGNIMTLRFGMDQ